MYNKDYDYYYDVAMNLINGVPEFLPVKFHFPILGQYVVSPKIRSADGGGTVVFSNTQGTQKYVS